MTKEELEKEAEEYAGTVHRYRDAQGETEQMEDVAEAWKKGYEACRPKWHKVADGDLPKGEEYGENSIHRKIYLKDRYGNLYTGNYYPKDKSHPEDCFAVEFLNWGLQGSQFCAKEQISEWCETSTFDKE